MKTPYRLRGSVLSLASMTLFGLPVLALATDIRLEKDIDYLGDGRAEKADLYLPADTGNPTLYPAVVMVHGGGWIYGDKGAATEKNIGKTLAENGYVAMSINYMLNNKVESTWPRNLYDCKTAVRWLRKNAARLHIAPDRIGAIGDSAGGHLAVMLAVTGVDAGLDPTEPYCEYSCHVQAAVDLYGPMSWFSKKDVPMLHWKRTEKPELYRQATPMTYVDKDDPPILIIQGDADKMVDVTDSELLAATLAAAGVVHQLVILHGAAHAFDLQPKQQDLRPLVVGFFDRYVRTATK